MTAVARSAAMELYELQRDFETNPNIVKLVNEACGIWEVIEGSSTDNPCTFTCCPVSVCCSCGGRRDECAHIQFVEIVKGGLLTSTWAEKSYVPLQATCSTRHIELSRTELKSNFRKHAQALLNVSEDDLDDVPVGKLQQVIDKLASLCVSLDCNAIEGSPVEPENDPVARRGQYAEVFGTQEKYRRGGNSGTGASSSEITDLPQPSGGLHSKPLRKNTQKKLVVLPTLTGAFRRPIEHAVKNK